MSEQKEVRRGIGTAIAERLLAGDTNDMALAAVKAEFPESGTTKATVSWYRAELRKQGKPVPTAAEAKKGQKPAAEEPAPDPLD